MLYRQYLIKNNVYNRRQDTQIAYQRVKLSYTDENFYNP